MKKLALAVATSAIGAYAGAATVTEFANGVLVPYAVHSGSAQQSTAVGLTSCAGGTVYWTFFDVDTKHVTDGEFDMTAYDQHSFIWSDESGIGLEDTLGYLVFVLDTTGDQRLTIDPVDVSSSDVPCLAGNAFQIDASTSDVAYLPALPISASDFGVTSVGLSRDLRFLDEDDLEELEAGADEGDEIYFRYFIDGGASTDIIIWSADDLSNPDGVTVLMYDDQQNAKSVQLPLPNRELNIVDPTTIIGRPADYVDGFIRWRVPEGVDGVFSWSIVDAPAFGAVQTVINPIDLMTTDGREEVRVRATVTTD